MSGRASSTWLIVGVFLAPWLLAYGQEKETGQPPPPANDKPGAAKPDLTIRPGHTVRWSKDCDAKTLDELKAGRLRLGITIKAFDPPTPGPTAFVVYSIPSKDAKRQKFAKFGITPNAPFRVSDGAAPQKFLISLQKYVASVKGSKLNVEVGFDEESEKLESGMAEVTFELVRIK